MITHALKKTEKRLKPMKIQAKNSIVLVNEHAYATERI